MGFGCLLEHKCDYLCPLLKYRNSRICVTPVSIVVSMETCFTLYLSEAKPPALAIVQGGADININNCAWDVTTFSFPE